MQRLLAALMCAFLIASPAWADTTPGNLGVATTTLVSGLLPFDQGPGTDTALGFDTTTFDVSAGLLILKAGGVADSKLASTFLKVNPALGNATGGTLALTGNFTSNITGSTQCVHANASGVLSGTGSDCGAGGGGTITGSGTANTLTKWTGSTAIGNSSITDAAGGVVVGSPTGGAKGAGTLNATGLYINGVAAAAGGSGTVNSGTTPQAAYYPTSGTAVGGASGVTYPGGNSIAVGSPSGSAPSTGFVDVAGGFQVNGVNVGQVVAGTSQTVSAAQWAVGTTFIVSTSSQTLTLPATSTLSTSGGIVIQTVGQAVSLAPNGTDTINGVNSTATIASGLTSFVSTNGAGAVYATPTTAGSGVTSVATTSPITGGTITTTGTIACATCVTSAASLTSTGVVLGAGSQGAATATDITFASGILSLGTNTSELGGVKMFGGTSGNLTIQPSAAAGTNLVATFPANTGTVAELNLAQTWTAAQTHTSAAPQIILGVNTTTLGAIKMFGNTSGDLTIEPSATAGTSSVATFPANTGTVAELNLAQSWTAPQRTNTNTPTISTTTFTPVFSSGQNIRIDFPATTCSCTIANPAAIVAGQSGMFELVQGGTSASANPTWGSEYLYAGGTSAITLTTTLSGVDYIPYYVDSTGSFIILGGIISEPTH